MLRRGTPLYECPACAEISVRLVPKSVSGLCRNQCPACTEISVQLAPKYANDLKLFFEGLTNRNNLSYLKLGDQRYHEALTNKNFGVKILSQSDGAAILSITNNTQGSTTQNEFQLVYSGYAMTLNANESQNGPQLISLDLNELFPKSPRKKYPIGFVPGNLPPLLFSISVSGSLSTPDCTFYYGVVSYDGRALWFPGGIFDPIDKFFEGMAGESSKTAHFLSSEQANSLRTVSIKDFNK